LAADAREITGIRETEERIVRAFASARANSEEGKRERERERERKRDCQVNLASKTWIVVREGTGNLERERDPAFFSTPGDSKHLEAAGNKTESCARGKNSVRGKSRERNKRRGGADSECPFDFIVVTRRARSYLPGNEKKTTRRRSDLGGALRSCNSNGEGEREREREREGGGER